MHNLTRMMMMCSERIEVAGSEHIVENSDDRTEKGIEKLSQLQPPQDAKLFLDNRQVVALLLDLQLDSRWSKVTAPYRTLVGSSVQHGEQGEIEGLRANVEVAYGLLEARGSI
jgi:hypothetical protein